MFIESIDENDYDADDNEDDDDDEEEEKEANNDDDDDDDNDDDDNRVLLHKYRELIWLTVCNDDNTQRMNPDYPALLFVKLMLVYHNDEQLMDKHET